jgi:hypothetical protein
MSDSAIYFCSILFFKYIFYESQRGKKGQFFPVPLHEGIYRGKRYRSIHSYPWHWMEMNSSLHVPAA